MVNRRTLLAEVACASSVSITGCLGNSVLGNSPEAGERAEETYERCNWIAIGYASFPADIRAEIDAALEDGQYQTEHLLLTQAIDPERSYIRMDDQPLKPDVRKVSGKTVLELHEVDVVRAPQPRPISIKNNDTVDHDVHIEVKNGETRIDETVHIEADESITIDGPRAFTDYAVTSRLSTGHGSEATETITVSEDTVGIDVRIGTDDIAVFPFVGDLKPCEWDVRRTRSPE